MKTTEDALRRFVRAHLAEHFRHGGSPHQHTSDSDRALKAMQGNPALQRAFDAVDKPRELAAILEELIDATGMTREDIARALTVLMRHERPRGGTAAL